MSECDDIMCSPGKMSEQGSQLGLLPDLRLMYIRVSRKVSKRRI